VFIGEARRDAAAGSAVEEADLDEEGFVNLFERVLFFGERGASVFNPPARRRTSR